MAFVKIEDKTNEAEIVVFPNLFEQIGAKLVQDAVIRVGGKVNARDRDGNLRSEASVIADEIIEITDEELRSYESTGRKMQAPKMSAQVKARRVAEYKAKKSGAPLPPSTPKPSTAEEEPKKATPVIAPEIPVIKKLFVNIKDPDDHESLHALRQVCTEFVGNSDIVLVLGSEKKSAIKLPFQVEINDVLIGELVKLLGEDCVVIK
jgi:DNA polymerase III alpha subunit